MVLIYHNITPPEFFVDVNKELVRLCFRGRRELGLYRSRCDLALGDSEYNRDELDALGFSPTGVLPVVPGFEHLAVADYRTAGEFDDDWVNVLFVGRVIPNKRFEDVIRAFQAYKTFFNPRSRLLLVGSHAGFERYVMMLRSLIARLDARDVHLVGHVSNEELAAYYEIADVFVSASEHEGFCVPLIESFHMGVPVIAYAATAVPSTMDGGGVLYTDKDPMHMAALINAVVDDRAVTERIIDGQFAALDRLEAKDFAGTLTRHIDSVLASPRREHPPVAFDFWDQVARAEEFDELKQYRPAAFQALPPDPGAGDGEPGTGTPADPGSQLPAPVKAQA
jgi:glycosyltransferase involved in cell wall biosynthesis